MYNTSTFEPIISSFNVTHNQTYMHELALTE